jgi:hypothetical protein
MKRPRMYFMVFCKADRFSLTFKARLIVVIFPCRLLVRTDRALLTSVSQAEDESLVEGASNVVRSGEVNHVSGFTIEI